MKKVTDTITHQFSRTLGLPPLLLCLMCLLPGQNLFAQCADVTLGSQAEIDAFNCTEVTGRLTISGGDITNLDGLSELTSVRSTLRIAHNPQLQDISGLQQLTNIGRSLKIANTANYKICPDYHSWSASG
jgi:hypothetical protein